MNTVNPSPVPMKIISIVALTALILISAVLYSSSTIAGPEAVSTTVSEKVELSKLAGMQETKPETTEIAMLQPFSFQHRRGNEQAEEPEPTLIEILLPVATWFLGSALLAMVGYKRMRNSVTGTD